MGTAKSIRTKIFVTIVGIFTLGLAIVLYRVSAISAIMERVDGISRIATDAGLDISVLQQEIANIDSQSTTIVIISTIVAFTIAVVGAYLVSESAVKRLYWHENLLDNIPFPLSVTDNNMNWTFINKPVEDMLSLKRKEVMGKHCSNWGAAICGTEKCGITRINNGEPETYFDQLGGNFKINTAYLTDKKGKRIGHVEVVQVITEMVKRQREEAALVKEIGQISHQFVAMSKQIADGSQSLAQGSTEQAASVQQLSASIADIAQKTKDNADKAERAAMLAGDIKLSAEKGNAQMDEMMTAVKEINESSQSIGKVIKVIDDIAFQTNILALNAAVEAARAGQHGKGFAVVAEEVRTLASKSAEAAKDTEGLIADSIQKAELGSRIADETAASLAEIVTGIGESNQLVAEIATSSEEQTAGIEQINRGIDQVAQVVQQTSATAEQSAASSQEMNEQSMMLDDLIERFNQELNEELEHQSLPPASQ